MRILLMTLLVAISCTGFSDKDKLMQYIKNSANIGIIHNDDSENSITRYDEMSNIIDCHWFDKRDKIISYAFYNKFYETDNAYFKVNFASTGEIESIKGNPFYISTNLLDDESIVTDTVKAFFYLSNSPFLSPKASIKTSNKTIEEVNLIEKENSELMLYYEDHILLPIQKMEYKFYYEIKSIKYKDSVIYNTEIKRT